MSCLFCEVVAGRLPAHVVRADEHAVAFLDLRPAARGHTLVVPRPSSTVQDTTRRGECAVAGSVPADRWARHLEALREEAGEEQAPR